MKTILLLIATFIITTFYAQNLPTILDTNNQIIEHERFILSYNETHEQANWIHYTLKASDLKGNKVTRSNNFRIDTLVITGTANNYDYKSQGYDRGHLKPAADAGSNTNHMEETFYYSNISPQKASFNRGIWLKLEKEARYHATQSDSVIIVTGGVLKEGLKTIGLNKVSVPDHFYKILYIYKGCTTQIKAYLIPNQKSFNQTNYYLTTLNKLKQLTNITFYQP